MNYRTYGKMQHTCSFWTKKTKALFEEMQLNAYI